MNRCYRWAGPVLLIGIFAACGGDGENNAREGIIEEVEPEAQLDSLERMNLVLAWVGDQPITGGDVKEHMLLSSPAQNVEEHIKNPDILQLALNALVDQFVWAELARREGITLTPHETRRVQALGAEFLAKRYMEDIVQEEARPGPEEVEAWYNEHQDRYLRPVRVAVRHILVSSREMAERFKDEVESGADFATLAREHSLDDNSRDLGGALGYVEKGKEILGIGRHSAFVNEVLVLNPGEMAVIETGKGWHLVRVEKKEGGDLQPLDEVFSEISDLLLKQRFWQHVVDRQEQAREATDARILAENFEAFSGISENVSRIMEMAKKHPDPGGRTVLYRRVAHDFEDDPRAPEAQFLIAYNQYLLRDLPLARKALMRLQRKWPDSKWHVAGHWLEEHLLEPPEEVGSVEDILNRVFPSQK